MKRICFIAALMLLFASVIAVSASAEQSWYEIQDGVLTVRLECDLSSGHRWDFEIADPTLLEMITAEYIGDEDGEIAEDAVPAWVASFTNTWAASFTNFSGNAGETTVYFHCYGSSPDSAEASADEGTILHTLETRVTVDAEGAVSLSYVTARPAEEIQGYADLPSPMALVSNITSDGVEFTMGYINVSQGEEFAQFTFYNSEPCILPLAPDAVVMLPESLYDPFALSDIADPAAWYASACDTYSDTYSFTYMFFAVMETGADGITSMEYVYVP